MTDYKAWLDAMPVEDVQRKIERLEQKLSDLLVLTRLHADRLPGIADAVPQESGGEEAAFESTGEDTPSD